MVYLLDQYDFQFFHKQTHLPPQMFLKYISIILNGHKWNTMLFIKCTIMKNGTFKSNKSFLLILKQNVTWTCLKKGFVTTTPPWQKLRLHSCVVCISFFKEANKHSLISNNEDKSESALRRQHAQPRHSQAEINSSLHCAYFRAPRGFKHTNRRAFHT